MNEASLLVVQGPDQGNRFDLTEPFLKIGRGTQNGFRILDADVSPQHALMVRKSGKWRLDDLDSASGTFVNGRSIRSTQLHPGDHIQVGRTVLLFSTTEVAKSVAAEKISLVPHSPTEDASRIVGQADSHAADALNWSQAGANLQLLYQITEEAVRPTASLDESLTRIMDLTLGAVAADRGCMFVADAKTDRIEPRVVNHRIGVDVSERMPVSTSIVEYVIQNGQGVRTSDAQHDSRFDATKSILKSGIREAMCVPMHGRFELMGVIYVDTTTAMSHSMSYQSKFSDSLLRLLLAIGRQSALAIENFRFQDALVKSERLAAVGQTIAILSHHVKNIMQGVRGGGYLIDMGLNQDNDELVRKGWGIVDRNQARINNLIMDMLTFSKERQPKLEPSQIGPVITDICELMQTRFDEENIEWKIEIERDIPISMFDSEGMHRVILNIVTNAIEALADQQGGHLTIRAGIDRDEDQLWVEVEDDGPGISEEDLPRLFNLFDSDKGARGTGLGLAVSRKILKEHGGDIKVRSETGQGTCFRLEWPYQEDDQRNEDE